MIWRNAYEKKTNPNAHLFDRAASAGGTYCHSASASGDVATAIEGTWTAAQGQVKTVVNNVVFPVIDMILAVLFFVKIATAYMVTGSTGNLTLPPRRFCSPASFLPDCALYIWTIL